MSSADERFKIAMQLHKAGMIDNEAVEDIARQGEITPKGHAEYAMRYGAQARGRRTPSYEDKLCMRMGWNDVKDMPNTVRLSIVNSGNSIFLTVVTLHNDEAVVIKDDPLMFPSDVVVTQLRMLCSA